MQRTQTWNYKTTKAVKYLSFENQSSRKYSVNRVFSGLLTDHWHYSNTSLFSLSSTSPLPVLAPSSWLVTKKRSSLGYVLKGSFTVIYPSYVLEPLLLLRSPIIPRSRNLFRNIRYVFTMLIEQVQDSNHHFLCSLPSLRSICCYHYQWFSSRHTSTPRSNWLDTNVI